MPTADARPRSLERTVRLSATPGGRDLRSGSDLAIEPPATHVHDLPAGTLLDDHLAEADRRALEGEAQARFARWAERHGPALSVDGTDVGWIWADELMADVFLPEVVTVLGLQRVLAEHPELERLELGGIDAELAGCLARTLDVAVTPAAAPPPPPSYPRRLAEPRTPPAWRRVYRAALSTAGMPPRPRGDVLVLPYWHLEGLVRRMPAETGLVPLLDPRSLPPLPAGELLASLRRGGWTGSPNALQVARSRRALARRLAAIRTAGPDGDALDTLLGQRAARLLAQRAGATLAEVASTRRALRRARARGVLLGWDSPPNARAVVAAARQAGVPVVVVQHGFVSDPLSPDKTVSDAAAVWSDADVDLLGGRARGRVVVTGNPGGQLDVRRTPGARTVILPEYRGRQSLVVGHRATARSVGLALEALEAARPGTTAVVRPHPADPDPGGYAALAPRHPGLRLEVDATNPIAHVLATADLCIGSVSTATLQAAHAGVPTIFLDVSAGPRTWPFDHSGALPVATDAPGLEQAIRSVLAGGETTDAEAIATALGAAPDATERVLALLRETFAVR